MSFWKNRLDQNTTEKFDRFCPVVLWSKHFEINWPLVILCYKSSNGLLRNVFEDFIAKLPRIRSFFSWIDEQKIPNFISLEISCYKCSYGIVRNMVMVKGKLVWVELGCVSGRFAINQELNWGRIRAQVKR